MLVGGNLVYTHTHSQLTQKQNSCGRLPRLCIRAQMLGIIPGMFPQTQMELLGNAWTLKFMSVALGGTWFFMVSDVGLRHFERAAWPGWNKSLKSCRPRAVFPRLGADWCLSAWVCRCQSDWVQHSLAFTEQLCTSTWRSTCICRRNQTAMAACSETPNVTEIKLNIQK